MVNNNRFLVLLVGLVFLFFLGGCVVPIDSEKIDDFVPPVIDDEDVEIIEDVIDENVSDDELVDDQIDVDEDIDEYVDEEVDFDVPVNVSDDDLVDDQIDVDEDIDDVLDENVSLPSKPFFESPMTVVNRREAEMVRERILLGVEPQASAYNVLIADAEAALKFESNPPEHMNVMGGYETNSNLGTMRRIMEDESMAAYSTALAWLYSGDDKYAAKSAEILRGWAETGTTFDGKDAALQLGSWFNRILYAADILKEYPGWTVEDRELFNDWWSENILPLTRDIMYRTTNNWKDAGLLGVLTAAVVLEDHDLMSEGLEVLDSYFGERRKNVNWKFANDENGVYLPEEVTRNDGRSGLTYTAYALTSIVQSFEIARYYGYDWWHREADNGATMKGVIEYYFRWMDLKEDFPWNPNPSRYSTSGPRRNPYELANNFFPGEIEGLEEWLDSYRPVNGRQGDPYITLNRGDLLLE